MASSTTYNAPISGPEKLSIFALAAFVLVLAIGSAFAAGWVIGRMLL